MKKTSKPPRAPSYPRHTPVRSQINRRKLVQGGSGRAGKRQGGSFLSWLLDFFKQ